jgi:tryptophan 2,3-dioxygenase
VADNRYYDYIRLKDLLSCQVPRSKAHHEMFFIIIHQVYELWFKSILIELNSVIKTFREGESRLTENGPPRGIDEKDVVAIVFTLNRIIEILKLLVAQVRVMETLTPLDFLDFREKLLPASGYHSLQFRTIEVKLGLKLNAGRTGEFKGHEFPDKEKYLGNSFAEDQLRALMKAEGNDSLFDHVDRWLQRTPFIRPKGRGSWLENELNKPKQVNKKSSDHDAIVGMRDIFNHEKYQGFLDDIAKELGSPGRTGLSHSAFLAALFIHLYRDEPILQQPHRLLESLKEIDELFTVWRNWHSSMVMRMIGKKPGTAAYDLKHKGNEKVYGYQYLAGTRVYRFFPELDRVSTYMIPRAYLPEIPAAVMRDMKRLLFSPRTTAMNHANSKIRLKPPKLS